MPEIFVITSADELLYYNPRFKFVMNKELDFSPSNQPLQENFWVINEIKKHHLSKIYDKMMRDKRKRFYLTHDYYWFGGIEEWLDQLKADPRFEYKGMQSFKGLNIYRFDLAR